MSSTKNTFSGTGGASSSGSGKTGTTQNAGSLGGIVGTTAYVTSMARPAAQNASTFFPTPQIIVPIIKVVPVSALPSGCTQTGSLNLDISGTIKQYTSYGGVITDFVASLNRYLNTNFTQNVNGASPATGIYYAGGVTANGAMTITPVYSGASAECKVQLALCLTPATSRGTGAATDLRFRYNPNLFYDTCLNNFFTLGYTNTTISATAVTSPATTTTYGICTLPTTVFSGTVMQSRTTNVADIAQIPTGSSTTVAASLGITAPINFSLTYYMALPQATAYTPNANYTILNTTTISQFTDAGANTNTNSPGNAYLAQASTLSISITSLASYADFINAIIAAVNSDMTTRCSNNTAYYTPTYVFGNPTVPVYNGNTFTYTANQTVCNPLNMPWYNANITGSGFVRIATSPTAITNTIPVNYGNGTWNVSQYLYETGGTGSSNNTLLFFPHDFTPVLTYPSNPVAGQPSAAIVNALLGNPAAAPNEFPPGTFAGAAFALPLPRIFGFGSDRQIGYITTGGDVNSWMPSGYTWTSPSPIQLPSPTYQNLLNIGDGLISEPTDPVVHIGNAAVDTVYTANIGLQPSGALYQAGASGQYPVLTINAPLKYNWLQSFVSLCGGANPGQVAAGNNGLLYYSQFSGNSWGGMSYSATTNHVPNCGNYTVSEGSQTPAAQNGSLTPQSTQTLNNPFKQNGIRGLYVVVNQVTNGGGNDIVLGSNSNVTSFQSLFINNDTVAHKYLVQNTMQTICQDTYYSVALPVFSAGNLPVGNPGWNNGNPFPLSFGSQGQPGPQTTLVTLPYANSSFSQASSGCPQQTNFTAILQPGDAFMIMYSCINGSSIGTWYVTNSNQACGQVNNCQIAIF